MARHNNGRTPVRVLIVKVSCVNQIMGRIQSTCTNCQEHDKTFQIGSRFHSGRGGVALNLFRNYMYRYTWNTGSQCRIQYSISPRSAVYADTTHSSCMLERLMLRQIYLLCWDINSHAQQQSWKTYLVQTFQLLGRINRLFTPCALLRHGVYISLHTKLNKCSPSRHWLILWGLLWTDFLMLSRPICPLRKY